MTDDYIAWAQFWCPEPVAEDQVTLQEAREIYNLVDERIGDFAETSDFITRVLWIETAIRLARAGWAIAELEEAMWPVPHSVNVAALLRAGL